MKEPKAIREHARWAKAAGKCIQCQRPWYDGMCSCGQWGEAEKRILKLANEILETDRKKDEERLAKQRVLDIKRIDEKLLPAEELGRKLWGE